MSLSKSWITRMSLAFLAVGMIVMMAPLAVAASPPDTTIDTGPSGAVDSSQATFTFSSDQSPVTFECQLDSLGWVACTSPTTYTGLTGGPHTFDVRATNTDTSMTDPSPDTANWTATVPPDTTILTGPSGAVDSSEATFTFSSDQSPVTFECQLDSLGWVSCASPTTYTGLAEGPHTFDVRATNTTTTMTDPTPDSAAWTAAPPDTFIDSGPSGTAGSLAATFTFSSDQSPVTFECQVDGLGWAACTSPTTYPGLTVGPHTFDVRATNTDTLMTDPTPATAAWTIVNYRPDARIRPSGALFFVGNDRYADEFFHDATNQTVQASVHRGRSASFDIGMQNDGALADRFVVNGCKSSNGYGARYFVGGSNVTTRVVAGTYVTPVLPSGATLGMRLTISTSRYMDAGMQGCNISFTSVGNRWTYDWNRAETRVFR